MIRRWFIRSFFILSILLCFAAWGSSRWFRAGVWRAHKSAFFEVTSESGQVTTAWGHDDFDDDWTWFINETAPDGSFLSQTYSGDISWLGFGFGPSGIGASRSNKFISVPYWFLALLFSLGALWMWRKTGRRGTVGDSMVGSTFCRKCGYDLRESGEMKRCPECGTPFDLAETKTYLRRPRAGAWRRWGQRVAVLLVIFTVGMGGTWAWLYWDWDREQTAIEVLHAEDVSTKPLGGAWGEKLQNMLGSAGFVLTRAHEISLPPETDDPALAHLSAFTALDSIRLHRTKVTDASMMNLGKCPTLRAIEFDGQQITDAGLGQLRTLHSLDYLSLSGTQVTDAGLAELKAFPRLECLFLNDMSVTDAGLAHLRGLTALTLLNLRGTRVTAAGVAELRVALPKTMIEWSEPASSSP